MFKICVDHSVHHTLYVQEPNSANHNHKFDDFKEVLLTIFWKNSSRVGEERGTLCRKVFISKHKDYIVLLVLYGGQFQLHGDLTMRKEWCCFRRNSLVPLVEGDLLQHKRQGEAKLGFHFLEWHWTYLLWRLPSQFSWNCARVKFYCQRSGTNC